MKTQYANLPSLLKKEGLFCLWQYETRDGKKTKVPYCIRGYRADPGNKNTFSKFDQVVSLANGYLMGYESGDNREPPFCPNVTHG